MAVSADTTAYWMSAWGELPPEQVIFGESDHMKLVRRKIDRVAATNVPILIRGESGTGKEIVARAIHQQSCGEDAPFLRVSSANATASLLEMVRFDVDDRLAAQREASPSGESARCATLFLEEVSELDSDLQFKLTQPLEGDRCFLLRDETAAPLRVRLICATSRELEPEVEARNFRRDLFYVINAVSLDLPPLRHRRDDIPSLVQYFLETYNRRFGQQAEPPSARLMESLQRYDWPGNIRELANVIKSYVLWGSEELFSEQMFGREPYRHITEPPRTDVSSLKTITRQATHELERKIILKTLEEKHWNRKQAARALNISYRALLYKIKEAGLPPKRLQLSHGPAYLSPPAKSDQNVGTEGC